MYNKKLEGLNKALLKAALEAKKVAETIAKDIADGKIEGEQLEAKEYAYSYLKDALEGVSRIRVAIKHADIFENEGK